MAIQFREGWITFPPVTGRRARREATVHFTSNVRSAQAVLKGQNIRYSNSDKWLLEIEIDLDQSISGNSVTVSCDFVLRDSSGYYDDPYEGWVNFAVIADVV